MGAIQALWLSVCGDGAIAPIRALRGLSMDAPRKPLRTNALVNPLVILITNPLTTGLRALQELSRAYVIGKT